MAANPTQDMSLEERERFHREAEARVHTFRYDKPAPTARPKQSLHLVTGQELTFGVQVVRHGGENNMHYHTKSESAWFVYKGQARFIGINGVLAELGPMEGIFLPGGTRYRFEKFGDEDLEIFQMMGIENDGKGRSERINLEAHKEWMVDNKALLQYKEKEEAR